MKRGYDGQIVIDCKDNAVPSIDMKGEVTHKDLRILDTAIRRYWKTVYARSQEKEALDRLEKETAATEDDFLKAANKAEDEFDALEENFTDKKALNKVLKAYMNVFSIRASDPRAKKQIKFLEAQIHYINAEEAALEDARSERLEGEGDPVTAIKERETE